MKDKLNFDVSDANTILDSDSIGAFVRAGDDGTLIGHVSDALKVNFSNTSLAVTATDLDIRDLVFATDKVDVSGSEVSLDSATLAALENITVSATDLDIRDLAFATDSVDVSGSEVELGATTLAALENITVSATDLDIRDLAFATDKVDVSGSDVTISGDVNVTQGTSPWVVSATDLDIRDLDAAQDNVAIDGISAGGNALVINADGSLNVNADISVVNGHEKAEDAAHSSGDIGSYMLGVRQDVLASSTSADGDYASFKMSEAGALYVNLAESSTAIEVSDAALANSTALSAAITLGTADTAQLAASALSGRKYLSIYNNDNRKIFIGGSGVTAANGFPVSPGSYLDLRAGDACAVYFVGSAGETPSIRNLQLS